MERIISIAWASLLLICLLDFASAFQCYKCEYSQTGDNPAIGAYCQDTFHVDQFQGELIECDTQCYKYKMAEDGGHRYITRRGCFTSDLSLGDTCNEGVADNKELHIKLKCCQSETGPCNAAMTLAPTVIGTLAAVLALYYLYT
ncbi:hypothetical protein CAPTEDRAFT_219411 [Capitella teleta]|uniref:Protein sleepless n=1 Tax=Capitella teleta TaxID=283909 RepID=R7V355_CAPTE|nr:hypothetical protein CAPTEDRAFT_219411 [Capitella teleta]|eukprot:ELU10756.1 hypothetical protein CAPTEDRAFT_219411 [Capitella teleta]